MTAIDRAYAPLESGVGVGRVRGYYRRGRWVRPYSRSNPGRRSDTTNHRKAAGPAVAVTITIGGIAAAVTIPLSSPGSAASPDAGGKVQSRVEVTATWQIDFKHTETVLLADGYRPDLSTQFGTDCARHSYGLVHDFFRKNNCKWLGRAYLAIRGSRQNVILVAISWVDMGNVSLAERYKHLVDASGTGNVTELSREIGSYRNVKFSGDSYVSGIDGTAVWNTQVQPVDPTSTAVIYKVLKDVQQ
jgi:hypothetical protein